MSNTMTIEQYTALLKSHDWYFQRTEMASVRERGKRQRAYLVELANSRSDFHELFIEYKRAKSA